VLCSAFICIQFGFVVLWPLNYGAKAAHEMLVKLKKGLASRNYRNMNSKSGAQKLLILCDINVEHKHVDYSINSGYKSNSKIRIKQKSQHANVI